MLEKKNFEALFVTIFRPKISQFLTWLFTKFACFDNDLFWLSGGVQIIVAWCSLCSQSLVLFS